ncbi:hypothetical protein VP01_3647g6 [Puccinia sorghi]|uniref:Uncharacterized protein n=1 Tax=Puccinia sorghi TaxID=27349 RepID=A0A0L6UVC9_9BASI|nr:hypothetical protein VP01_3647g6 [Puccinia sorghi]
MVIKKPTKWNHFMKCQSARSVFRGSQKGICYFPGMAGMSQLWNKLSPMHPLAEASHTPGSQEDPPDTGESFIDIDSK